MPEQSEHSDNILVASQEVKNLKENKETPDALRKRAVEIGQTADNGAKDLQMTKVNSTEAKQYLDASVPKVTGYLKEIASNGREIIKNQSEKYETIDGLHNGLKGQLNAQRESINSFAKIEAADKNYEAITDTITTKNAVETLTLLKTLQQSLPAATESIAEYRGKVDTKISAAIKMITEFLPAKDKVLALGQNVGALGKLVTSYEKDPTPENLAALRVEMAKANPLTVSNEIFASLEKGEGNKLLQELWQNEYSTIKNQYEALSSRVDAKEGVGLTAQAEQMLSDVDANEKSLLTPEYEKYSKLALMTSIDDPAQMDAFIASEESLLNGYLVLKSTVGTYSNPQNLNKLKFETKQNVEKKAEDISGKIRQIEVNRETRKSRESLSKTRDLSTYITFLGKEENGKIYKFNAAYDALPADKKEDVRMAVELLIAKDHQDVQADTYQTTLKLAKSTGNFDELQEKMGEKSKDYFDGLKLMLAGKFEEAQAAFQKYIALSNSFSPEEKTQQKNAIDDANNRLNVMKASPDYLDGLSKLKANDMDGAEAALKKYLATTDAMSPDDKKLQGEQIQNAHEVLKLIGGQKIQEIKDLLSDVRKWKEAQIKGQIDKHAVKHDVEIGGPEIILIEQNIADLQARVAKGEVVDFKTEMANIKAKVTEYNQKNAINPEDNVIDKLDSLYEKFHSADPKEKKQAYVEFAKELRDMRSYDTARKYLDKAMDDDYKAAAKNVNKEKVLQQMLDDPKMMAGIREQARQYYQQFKKENPGCESYFTEEKAQQMIMKNVLNKQYNRELRKDMTDNGLDKTNDTLALYNEWSPYVSVEHFWQSGSFDAETRDQFWDEAKQTVALTLATLPVGMLAGSAGKVAGAMIFRAGASRFLTGPVLDAAVTAVERGGIMAIRPGTAAFGALEPAVQQMIIANSSNLALAGGASFAGGVIVEGGTLLLGNNIASGLVTGEGGKIDGEHIVESIIKAGIFRGIGFGGTKLFGDAIKAGGASAVKGVVGMEAFSGIAGTTVEAGGLYITGHGKEVDTSFVLKSLMQNAMASGGSHIMHGVIELPNMPSGPGRAGKRMFKAGEVEVSSNDPDVTAVHSESPTKQMGQGGQFKGEHETLHQGSPTLVHEGTPTGVHSESPTKQQGEGGLFKGEKPTAVVQEPVVISKVSFNEGTAVESRGSRRVSENGAPLPGEKSEPMTVEKRQELTATVKATLDDSSAVVNSLRQKDPTLTLEAIRQKVDGLPDTDLAILSANGDVPPDIAGQILNRGGDKMVDVVDGQRVIVRYYEGNHLDAGALGRVSDVYYVVTDSEGRPLPDGPQLRKGALKQSTVQNADPNVVQFETDSLRQARDLPDRKNIQAPVFIGGDGRIIMPKIESMGFEIPLKRKNPLTGKQENVLDADGNVVMTPTVNLSKIYQMVPPEQMFSLFGDFFNGIDELHNSGNAHFDAKRANGFYGMVDGKPTVLLGDIAMFPPADFVLLSTFSIEGIGHVVLRKGWDQNVPTSPSYYGQDYGGPLLDHAIEYVKQKAKQTLSPEDLAIFEDPNGDPAKRKAIGDRLLSDGEKKILVDAADRGYVIRDTEDVGGQFNKWCQRNPGKISPDVQANINAKIADLQARQKESAIKQDGNGMLYIDQNAKTATTADTVKVFKEISALIGPVASANMPAPSLSVQP